MNITDLRQLFSLLSSFRAEGHNRSEAVRLVMGEVACEIVEREREEQRKCTGGS